MSFNPLEVGAAVSRPRFADSTPADQVPAHVGFIMDGNGRWAKARGLNVALGHRAGLKSLEAVLEHCRERGVQYATCYAFSTENWSRPSDEVAELLRLTRFYLNNKIDALAKKGVRLRVIGRLSDFPEKMVQLIERAQERTAHNDRFHLTLALSYGGRHELVAAAQALATQVAKGEIAPDDIDERRFADSLFTRDLPDPDIIIRTSGEMRLSNFLLWQMAYSELHFSPTLWPDFNADEIDQIFAGLTRRERRFGGRPSAPVAAVLPLSQKAG